MAAFSGLAGLYGPPAQAQQVMDQGVLEARAAPGTATSHGQTGSQTFGYGGTVPTEPQTNQVQQVYDGETDGDQYWGYDFYTGDLPSDLTPTTHAGAWPAGIPQEGFASLSNPGGLEVYGTQMEILHGNDEGGVRANIGRDPAGREIITSYTTDDYAAPNQNYLSSAVPEQLKALNGGSPGQAGGGGRAGGNAGGSNADPDQGYGVLNSMPEFNRGHSIRRVQHDRMPWDFTNTHGEQQVPFLGRHDIVGQMDLNGPDSPYYQAGELGGSGLSVPWEGRIGNPTEYVQPPVPDINPPNWQDSSQDVWAAW